MSSLISKILRSSYNNNNKRHFPHLFRSKDEIDYLAIEKTIKDVVEKQNSFSFKSLNLKDAEVYYLPTKGHSWVGVMSGLFDDYQMQKYKLHEKNKLRKGTQNYLRIIKRNGLVDRIESFRSGTIDVVYLAYYEDNIRYLFPFSETGFIYPTYICVSVWEGNEVIEAFLVNDVQIVLQQYNKLNDYETEIVYLNAIPKGEIPLLEHYYGIIQTKGSIELRWKSVYYWEMSI